MLGKLTPHYDIRSAPSLHAAKREKLSGPVHFRATLSIPTETNGRDVEIDPLLFVAIDRENINL